VHASFQQALCSRCRSLASSKRCGIPPNAHSLPCKNEPGIANGTGGHLIRRPADARVRPPATGRPSLRGGVWASPWMARHRMQACGRSVEPKPWNRSRTAYLVLILLCGATRPAPARLPPSRFYSRAPQSARQVEPQGPPAMTVAQHALLPLPHSRIILCCVHKTSDWAMLLSLSV
jgi:hypothetical protein